MQAPYVDGWVLLRDKVRIAVKGGASQGKLMELTDRDRDENMVDAGVCVLDEGNTSTWRLDDPSILQRERDERRLKVKEEKLRVLRQKRLQKANLLEKHEAASISPKEVFKGKDEFKDFAFDERGVPTHDKEGNELTKSAKKKVEAGYKKAAADHEKFKDSLAKDPHFLQNMQTELQEIDSLILQLEQNR
jgi:cysteinyl-tRNA synthetase